MHVEFWGAAGEVTGSMHLVEANGKRILLDCGLYQGRRKNAFERNRDLPFDPGSIDAVVLSHAHIDHSGNLPSLVRMGYRGDVFATSATRDLAAYMLMDSAHLQEQDVEFVNRRRRREGRRLFEPLYTQKDAELTLQQFTTVEYERPFEPAKGVQATFINAGHMLGSASVALDLSEGRRRIRLVFSGDVGVNGFPLLRDPKTFPDANVLIMESTYGDRLHPPIEETAELLGQYVREAYERKGKLLIPAFAVGRTQEVVYRLNLLQEAGKLPPIDVYIDSPLAIHATDVFRLHPECYDVEALDAAIAEKDHDPLSFPRLHYVREAAASKKLSASKKPAVVLSAAGMCESGRILHHLRAGIADPKNTVLFVGFQAENTLGRRILSGASPVPILGEMFEVRAKIAKLEGCSAHADQSGLLDWAEKTRAAGQLERVFLVHGEDHPRETLAGLLRGQGVLEVLLPRRGQRFEL